ncbi:MAG TPA: CsbD family protein [Aliidongia sp.]|nr:CsbD family protein [Aliidongia sp.]
MDKQRVVGAAQQAKGSVKEAAGKVTGNKKLETSGAIDKAEGKIREGVGKAKDTVRQAAKH